MLRSSLRVVLLTYALIIYSSLNCIDEFFVIQGTQVLVLKLDGKPETATLPCAPSDYSLLGSNTNIFELQSSIGRQSNLN